MPPTLPSGAKYLPLPAIMPTGGSQTIQDISSSYWFSALKPTTSVAPKDLRVRQFQYAPGANLIWTPGSEQSGSSGFWVLREVADSWDLLRIVIETVKDRICALDFEFRLQPEDEESKNDLASRTKADPRIAALTNFFRYPDGHHTFRDWLRMIWEDIIVLDAGAIYLERDKKGKICSLRPVDGATINRQITDQGFVPPYPDIAYQQVLYGLPAINLTIADLCYVMRNPRTWKRYGFGPVEQMLVTIGIGLRKQDSDMKYWTEGNIPEALCFLPPDLPIDKVQEIQGWYDSILAGNNAMRRRMTFLPGYGSAKDQSFRPNIVFPKAGSETMKTPWDEWQMQLICYGMGTTPGQLMKMMNRATANQSAETAEEEGLEPKIKTTEAFLNYIIQSEYGFGFADIEASCVQRREQDAQKQMEIDTGYASKGIITVNEARIDLGKDPFDSSKFPEADEPGIMTLNGFVPLKLMPNLLSGAGPGAGPVGGTSGAKPKPAPGKKLPAKKTLALLSDGEGGASFLKASTAIALDPTHMTPEIADAQAQIFDVTRKVFRRQKERATQAATEMLKKKKLSSTEKVLKFNENHDPETGEFVSDFSGYSVHYETSPAKLWVKPGSEISKKVLNIEDVVPGHSIGHPEIVQNLITNNKRIDAIVVIKSSADPGKYEVVDGNHRLQALKNLGFSKIPATVVDEDAAIGWKVIKVKYKFCSTQVNVPTAEAEDIVDRGRVLIPDSDLAGKGRELEPHITVKYGVDCDPVALSVVLERFQPFEVKLGRVICFEPKNQALGKFNPNHAENGEFSSDDGSADFQAKLKEKYKWGLVLYHETPASNLESIKQNGLRASGESAEAIFGTIDQASSFVSGDKLIAQIKVYPNEYKYLSPDMRYDGAKDLLSQHPDLKGADVAFDPPSKLKVSAVHDGSGNQLYAVGQGYSEEWPGLDTSSKHGKILKIDEDDAAPMVIDVDSPELRFLHDVIGAAIGVKEDNFEYHPHLTLAYVSPDAADKYKEDPTFEGKTFLVDTIVLTTTDGDEMPLSLGKGLLGKFNENHDEKGWFATAEETLYHGTTQDKADLIIVHGLKTKKNLPTVTTKKEEAEEAAKLVAAETGGKPVVVSLKSSANQYFDNGKTDVGISTYRNSSVRTIHPKHIDEVTPVTKFRKAESDEDDFAAEINRVVDEEWLALPSQVRESILASFNAGIEKGIDELSISDMDMISSLNQTARDWAANRAAELVGMRYDVDGELVPNPNAEWAISDTTRERIKEIVAKAFEDETSIASIADDISAAGIFSDSRALMIANQETKQAQVSGNYETWDQSGLVEKLKWMMSSSHDVDDVCDLNDGEVVNFGEPFPSGDYYPLAHVGCECSVVPAKITGVDL